MRSLEFGLALSQVRSAKSTYTKTRSSAITGQTTVKMSVIAFTVVEQFSSCRYTSTRLLAFENDQYRPKIPLQGVFFLQIKSVKNHDLVSHISRKWAIHDRGVKMLMG
jgi:hypothetical protein